MAINFGRLGTVKLNGGARLVCTPESQITSSGGGGASAPPSISSLTLLNRFIKHHILLDLAYT